MSHIRRGSRIVLYLKALKYTQKYILNLIFLLYSRKYFPIGTYVDLLYSTTCIFTQFNTMYNEITVSLVTVQYHVKGPNHLLQEKYLYIISNILFVHMVVIEFMSAMSGLKTWSLELNTLGTTYCSF